MASGQPRRAVLSPSRVAKEDRSRVSESLIRLGEEGQREAAGLYPGQVHHGEAEACPLNRGKNRGADRLGDRSDQLMLGQLDPSDVTVVAHTEIVESQTAQACLGLFDLPQLLGADDLMMGDSRCQARSSRLVRAGKLPCAGEAAHVCLGQAGVGQWP